MGEPAANKDQTEPQRGFIRRTLLLLKDTAIAWYKAEPFQNSAVIAFYTILSMPGLLVITVVVAGQFVSPDALTGGISRQIEDFVGLNAAEDIQAIVESARHTEDKLVPSLIGIFTLVFGATGVFYNMQKILNRIWGVAPKPRRTIIKILRARLFSFGLVLAVGFLLLVSLVVSTGLTAISDWIATHFSATHVVVVTLLDFAVSLVFVTLLFAAMYKFLPDARVRWRDVWVGALFTGGMFVLAKYLFGVWLSRLDVGSTYGAAGTVILLMLWISYGSLILLFGAHFTRIYADRFGRTIKPARGAEPIEPTVKRF